MPMTMTDHFADIGKTEVQPITAQKTRGSGLATILDSCQSDQHATAVCMPASHHKTPRCIRVVPKPQLQWYHAFWPQVHGLLQAALVPVPYIQFTAIISPSNCIEQHNHMSKGNALCQLHTESHDDCILQWHHAMYLLQADRQCTPICSTCQQVDTHVTVV